MASPLKHRLHRFSRFSGIPLRGKKQITQIALLVASCWLLVSNCYAQPSDYIRVAILEDATSVSIKIKGLFKIIQAGTNNVLYRGKDLKTTVTTFRDGILIAGKSFNTDKVFISTNGPDAIIINDRVFMGSIQFIKKNNGKLLLVNHIGLEDYIKGIMYHEASHYWPKEALAAQAIICRTYALYTRKQSKLKSYDLTSDIYSQVYGGRISERYRTNKAVEETKGLVLTYQNKLIPTYYHSTCAGHTEDASLLWNVDIPPLKGLPCNFCKDSPHFNWHCVIFIGELREQLKNAGYKLGMIKEIHILGRDNSGRLTELGIVTDRNEVKITAKDFRNIIGPNIIRSTNFNVRIAGQDAVFEGVGWGHGVGLCQWGAYFMAKQGYTTEGILKYYYPGVEIISYEVNRF